MGTSHNLAEAQVLKDCRALLDILQTSGKLLYRRINVGGVPIAGNYTKMRRNFDMQGMADLLVFILCDEIPVTLHIECKSSRGTLSAQQKSWKEKLEKLGHSTYFVVRSIHDLVEILKQHGIKDWSCAHGKRQAYKTV